MMEHAMRRKDRQTTQAEARQLLQTGEYGVLSTVGADGLPYGVPLSYALQGDRLYFHCAVEGRKLQNLSACAQASFCVVGPTQLLPEQFSTRYESVIAEGTVREALDDEKLAALTLLVEKYAPAFAEKGAAYIQAAQARARIFCLEIGQLSGKARR